MKQIEVWVIPNAKKNQLLIMSTDSFKAYLTASARQGKANQALIKLLKRYFKVKTAQIIIVHGEKSRHKIVHIF